MDESFRELTAADSTAADAGAVDFARKKVTYRRCWLGCLALRVKPILQLYT